MNIRDFIEREKKITVFQLVIVVGVIIALIAGGVYFSSRVANGNRNDVVDVAVQEVMPDIESAIKSNNPNRTVVKVARDWNNDNKKSDVEVSVEEINDCVIVEAIHKKGNKSLNKTGDCSDLSENGVMNSSGSVLTIDGSSDLHISETIVITGDGFISGNNITATITAPNGREIVSEVVSDSEGNVEIEFIVPGSREYVGVWGYSINGEETAFDIKDKFIVSQ